MLGLLIFITLNTGQLQTSSTPIIEPFDFLAAQSQVLQSETCQKSELRQYDLMTIEDLKINKLLYFQTKAILKEARAAGKPIGLTSTFRNCAEQSSLRSSNCGGDVNTVASLPAESCSPPTEKPGDSLHNYGMAIDFKCSDSPIFGNSSCYEWLKQNASKYKLQQRAEEPWHWSFTGR
jgi:LAS superfamily LD-carboxypeptidase LdcB